MNRLELDKKRERAIVKNKTNKREQKGADMSVATKSDGHVKLVHDARG